MRKVREWTECGHSLAIMTLTQMSCSNQLEHATYFATEIVLEYKKKSIANKVYEVYLLNRIRII